jgi:hypothetical protein
LGDKIDEVMIFLLLEQRNPVLTAAEESGGRARQ